MRRAGLLLVFLVGCKATVNQQHSPGGTFTLTPWLGRDMTELHTHPHVYLTITRTRDGVVVESSTRDPRTG